MQTIEQLLAEAKAFNGMSQEHLGLIAGCARNKVFEDGEYLMREGNPANTFFVIRLGRVALEIFVPQRGGVTIETIDDGDLLGWSWLVPPFREHLDARALGPVHVVAFDAACLRGKADDDSVLGYELMRRFVPVIIERLQATRVRLLDVYGHVGAGLMVADPMVPVSYVVADKRQDLADTWTLELDPAGDDAVGEFNPGQFSMLYAFGAGEVPISVSGGGEAGGRVGHTIRAVGAATSALCTVEPGAQVGVRGPFGNSWPLVEAEGGDVVVVAGGIGLAPLRLAINHLIANRDSYRAVSLLYGARSPEEVLYPSELQRWREAGVNVVTSVDSAPSGWEGRVGLVTTLIPEAGFEGARTTAMVCGPEVMMRFVFTALQDRGVPLDSIYLSLERNMKCAVGHCGHCQLGHRFVCKDGPVFPVGRIGSLLGVREL